MQTEIQKLVKLRNTLENALGELENDWNDSRETQALRQRTQTMLEQATENVFTMVENMQPGYFKTATQNEMDRLRKEQHCDHI